MSLNRQRLQVDRLLFEDPRRLLALLLVVVQPGPGRDERADDHVLLEPSQAVYLAADRGFSEHAGGLLEGRRRQPRGGVQRRLDQAEQHGLGGCGLAALRQRPGVALLVLPLRDYLPRQQACVARGVDADLPHHLPDDHLDVLVVDVDTLRPVHLLDLVHEERLHRFLAEDMQQLLRRDGPFGDLLARLDEHLLAVSAVELGPDAHLVGDRVLANLLVECANRDFLGRYRHLPGVPGPDGVALGVAGQLLALHDVVLALDDRGHLAVERVGDLELLPGDHANLSRALLTDDLELPVDLGDDGLALRDASLEELFDARKALGDVHAGHAAGVESAHGQLGAGLADRLGGDDAHRLPDLDDLAGSQVSPVARAADALASLAHEHGTHLDRDTCGDDLASVLVGDRRAGGYEQLAADGDVLRRDPARDLLVNGVGLGPLRGDVADPDAVGGAAVLDAHDHVLRDVHEAARQVSGVGGAEGGVGKALARAVGRDEVLEHGEALGEVGHDRQVDDPARGVGHQATHARELADLLDVSAGARAHHHPDRAERVEGLLGRVADPLVGVLPELD